MGLPLFLVDAFTDRPFAGNPAAVCLLDRWPDAAMAAKRRGRNAAVRDGVPGERRELTSPSAGSRRKSKSTSAGTRRSPPRTSCGNRGLAEPSDVIHFSTRSGILKAARSQGEIELDFPLRAAQTADAPADLLPALGVAARYVGRNQFDYLIEVESEAVLRQMTPDFKRLATVPVRGTIVTSRSSDAQIRFRFPIFRPSSRHRRRPSHRLGPLLFGGLTGKSGSAKANSSPIRHPPAAALSACVWQANASSSAAQQ